MSTNRTLRPPQESGRWSSWLRISVTAGAVVIGVVVLSWLGLLAGVVPASIAVLGLVAGILVVMGGAATAGVAAAGRAIRRANLGGRDGRWLSLRERKTAVGAGLTDTVVDVEYHDTSGGPLGGVAVTYQVVGKDAIVPSVSDSTVITNDKGVAQIPIHVVISPTIVTLHASVLGDPGVDSVQADFLIGV